MYNILNSKLMTVEWLLIWSCSNLPAVYWLCLTKLYGRTMWPEWEDEGYTSWLAYWGTKIVPSASNYRFLLHLILFGLIINMLVCLIHQVHDKFDLMQETLFLTINLIDRFLAKQNVVRKKLQLVGLVAMLLACKYEEVSVPVVSDLIHISDRAYTRKELLEMVTYYPLNFSHLWIHWIQYN